MKLRLLLPAALAAIAANALALDGEPDGVAPESNAGLYVSTIDGVFLPRTLGLNGASWTPIHAVDGAASGNTRNFTLNTVADGSGAVFSGTVSYAIVDDSTVTASWRMAPSADVRLNALTVGFKTPVTLFAGGKVSLGSGTIDIPTQKLEENNEFVHAATRVFELYDTDGVRRLRIDFGAEVWATVQDNRKWTEQVLEIRFQKPNAARNGSLKDFSRGTTYAFDYTVTLSGDGVVDLGSAFVGAAGPDWIPLAPMGWVEPGSALDFSAFRGLPGAAGRFGRVVRRGPHFEFEERPGEPQRFYGVNLCYSTARPRSNEVAFAQNLLRIGYNAVRLHHVDFEMTWAQPGTEPARTNLQAWGTALFDRLVAACVTNGLYLTTDVYTGRETIPWREFGIDRDGETGVQNYKRLLLASEPAVSNLLDFARNFFGHVNPHTGRTLAQEPAMVGISLVNEDSVGPTTSPASLCADIPPLAPAWRAWIAAKKAEDPATYSDASDDPPAAMDRFFLRFIQERREALLARIAAVMRDELGCRAPFTDLNGIHISMSDLAARGALLDYADDHIYVDHPTFLGDGNRPPSSLANERPFRGAALGMTSYAALRLADRPYTITEYNFASPGKYRAAGGLSMGATAALQDWDGVWRFDWGNDDTDTCRPWTQTMGFLRVAGDPIQQFSERAASALFLRRDAAPLGPALVARLPTSFAAGPAADAKLQVAAPWRWAGWFARLGYVLADEAPEGALDLGAHPAADTRSDAEVRALLGLGGALPANALGVSAAGGAVTVNGGTGLFCIDAGRTAGGFAERGRGEAGPLSFELEGGSASVCAIALDGRTLAASDRILLTHLTDAVDTGMTFKNATRTVLTSFGTLPHLVRSGIAHVRLALGDGAAQAAVWALSPTGARVRQVASTVSGGVLAFDADVAADPSAATVAYEIVRAPRTAPAVFSVLPDVVSTNDASLAVAVPWMGEGSATATLEVVLDTGERRTLPLSETGIATVSFDGLAPGRSYTATVVATGSNGLASEPATLVFRTKGLAAPVFATPAADGVPALAFGGTAAAPVLAVSIANAAKGAWYTVYASDAVDGTYAAVTSEQATADGLKTLSIPAPASKPARFVRVGVSDAEISSGTELQPRTSIP